MSSVPARNADLDAPLPREIAGSSHGWWGDYQRYPVYSRPWAGGRLRTWGLAFGIWTAIVMTTLYAVRGEIAPVATGLLHLLAIFLLPIALGPALGVVIRRQRWPWRKEGVALAAATAALVLAVVGMQMWLIEPAKQQVAEWFGDVDAGGKRRAVRMAFGLSVENPRDEEMPAAAASGASTASAPAAADDEERWSPTNLAASMLITFWLAGGSALWSRRRQQSQLEALQARQALEAEQAARHEAELRLSVLAAQVEPHFLFNTLAGVRSAVTSDPRRASEMIDRLADYLRASIPRLRADGSASHTTLGAQLDIVRAYLGLMHARMPRLEVAIDSPPALNACRFPPLMLISLAENAVKHGVEPKIGPARIVVSAEAQAGELVVSVQDDGVGFGGGGSAGSGIGLQNVGERLRALYRDRAALVLKAAPGGGVIASIRIPLEDAVSPAAAAAGSAGAPAPPAAAPDAKEALR